MVEHCSTIYRKSFGICSNLSRKMWEKKWARALVNISNNIFRDWGTKPIFRKELPEPRHSGQTLQS